MVRLLPNYKIKLVHHEFVKTFGKANTATFHIEPRMTKIELQEYLSSVYNLTVLHVATVNLPKKNDSSKVIKKAMRLTARGVTALLHERSDDVASGRCGTVLGHSASIGVGARGER
ncbi:hypothetical protein T492DRAFT_875760 [Pavlovales sp. CCMP2436]|nr:hypothetical protein T492DRAFT_875760 [Pavlovales sp. CCMP2436]